MIFTVQRFINGKSFYKDSDRIFASDWNEAEMKLQIGKKLGKYDSSCVIDGILDSEINVSDDFILDIMIHEGLTNKQN